MQKKLIALAVAAAFSAPAFADNSNVTVYGKLNLDMENVQNDKAPVRSVTRVSSNASRFGVKGSEDLGDGLSAIWQLEAQYNTANNTTTTVAGGAAGQTVTNGAFDGVRNSNVGLKGNFGTVFLGNWDTPYKTTHNKVELFDNAGSFTSTLLIGHGGAAGGTNFVTRQASDIQYWTPNLSGFTGKVSFASDTAQNAAAANTAKKNRLSMSGEYENDMLYAALGYENRPAQTIASVTDTATRLVGAYKIDGSQIGLTYERLSIGTAANTSGTQNNWELSGNYKFGNSNLGAFYAQNGNIGATANSGAKMATLRYGYSFSKRTEVYGAYTSLKNDTAASYSIAGATAGSKQSAFGLGMIHNF
ncbi:MAG TPA: porin [Gallionella sp.]|nr:porin [Gallionella sp.]